MLLGLNQFVLTSSLHSKHFCWAGEDQGMGFFQCFSLFVALDHFCMGKTQKNSHSLLPNPTEMLATQANFLISMGYQTLCVTTIYVTPA